MKSRFSSRMQISGLQLVLALTILLPFTLVLAIVWVCQLFTQSSSTKRENVNIFVPCADYAKELVGVKQAPLSSNLSSSMSA